MINVTVVLPDRRKGQVQVDPLASIEEVKRTIVTDLQLGKPENFILAFAPTQDISIGMAQLQDGDIVFVMESQAARGNPAMLDPKSFK